MVKGLPLAVPLVGKVTVPIPDKGSVNGEYVFLPPDGLCVNFSAGEGIHEVKLDGEWEPSLSDFRIDVLGHIQICIDLSQDLWSDLLGVSH